MKRLRPITLAVLALCGWLPAQADTRPLVKQAADLVLAEQPAEALKILAKAKEQNPRNADVFVYMGEAHFQLEEYEKAVAAFRQAIATDPAIVPHIQNLGHALLRLQRPAEAREHFQLVAERTRSPGAKARALTGVGLALADEGQDALARARFAEALAIDPSLLRARYRLALIQLKAADPEGAAQNLRAIVAVDPLYEGAAYNLGLAYRALKNEAAAKEWEERFKEVRKAKRELEDLKVAWKQTPARVELMLGIARVYARSGSNADAVSWFTQYLAARPDDAAARAELEAVKARRR